MGGDTIETQLLDIQEKARQDSALLVRTYAMEKQSDFLTYLNAKVLGQDHIKPSLATNMLLMHKRAYDGMRGRKRNLLFIGPSGCGKTYMADAMIAAIDLPHAALNLGDTTAAGYYGEDLLNAFSAYAHDVTQHQARKRGPEPEGPFQVDANALFQQNPQRTKGVIFFDELDKTSPRFDLHNGFGKRLQIEVMKYLPGAYTRAYTSGVNEDRRSVQMNQPVVIDTSDITFIMAGAFIGLEEIIAKRTRRSKKAPRHELMKEFTKEDLTTYGIMPELLGRINQVYVFDELSEETLYRILTSNSSPLVENYREFKDVFGVKLMYRPEALRYIANVAYQHREYGARILESFCNDVCDELVQEIQGNILSNHVTITLPVVEQTLRKYEFKNTTRDMGFVPPVAEEKKKK